MKFRELGRTGMKVSEVGMGCWGIGGNEFGNSYGGTDDGESVKAVRKAVQLGCNFFDTADVYGHGHSEEILGIALKELREKVFLATKVGGAYMYENMTAKDNISKQSGHFWGHVNFTEEYIRFALEQSLRRLRTSWIDLYQLHNPSLKMIKDGEVFRPLREMQKEGKIKFVGVSVHTLEEGLAALDHVDSVQCVFNILNPKNFEMMETAKRRGVGIVVREPLINGFASGKYGPGSRFEEGDIRAGMPAEYIENLTGMMEEVRLRFPGKSLAQIAIKYVLSFDCVSTVIPGIKTEWQAIENLGASGIPELSKEEMAVFGS